MVDPRRFAFWARTRIVVGKGTVEDVLNMGGYLMEISVVVGAGWFLA